MLKRLQEILLRHWYKKINIFLSIFLLPFSILFFVIIKVRFLLYKFNIFKSYKLPVPVVIVGNITVGGVGKTPLTKHLALFLQEKNIQVGIVMRGYKSHIKSAKVVNKNDSSFVVGDEALIYALNDIPVAIGIDRYQAGLTLIKSYPNIQIILSDDGLQHYQLKRDYEIIIFNANRFVGNGYLLPMGPLRECISRVNAVNAIVINGFAVLPNVIKNKLSIDTLLVQQNLVLIDLYNPKKQLSMQVSDCDTNSLILISAIGDPESLYNFLLINGLFVKYRINFMDHYEYKLQDIPLNYDFVVVTEKDYVKLKNFDNDRIWVIRVNVHLNKEQLMNEIVDLVKL